MVLSNMIELSRICIYILSIVLLVSTIKTKNKKICSNNILVSIFFILYLYISIAVLPNVTGIEQGLDLLVIIPLLILDAIILIINIIICAKKLNKNELKDENSNFTKSYLIIFIIVPIAFVGISFFREITILNNSDLILTFNYQNGIVISENTRYAIGEKFCKEISISEKFINKTIQHSGYTTYNIKYSEVGKGYSITSYDDPELNEIDAVVVEQLYKDIKVDNNERHKASLYKIKGSSYYIISHYVSDNENEDGGMVIAEYIYNGTIRIDDIKVKGTIETANVYSY